METSVKEILNLQDEFIKARKPGAKDIKKRKRWKTTIQYNQWGGRKLSSKELENMKTGFARVNIVDKSEQDIFDLQDDFIQKAQTQVKEYTRTRRGKAERVGGYTRSWAQIAKEAKEKARKEGKEIPKEKGGISKEEDKFRIPAVPPLKGLKKDEYKELLKQGHTWREIKATGSADKARELLKPQEKVKPGPGAMTEKPESMFGGKKAPPISPEEEKKLEEKEPTKKEKKQAARKKFEERLGAAQELRGRIKEKRKEFEKFGKMGYTREEAKEIRDELDKAQKDVEDFMDSLISTAPKAELFKASVSKLISKIRALVRNLIRRTNIKAAKGKEAEVAKHKEQVQGILTKFTAWLKRLVGGLGQKKLKLNEEQRKHLETALQGMAKELKKRETARKWKLGRKKGMEKLKAAREQKKAEKEVAAKKKEGWSEEKKAEVAKKRKEGYEKYKAGKKQETPKPEAKEQKGGPKVSILTDKEAEGLKKRGYTDKDIEDLGKEGAKAAYHNNVSPKEAGLRGEMAKESFYNVLADIEESKPGGSKSIEEDAKKVGITFNKKAGEWQDKHGNSYTTEAIRDMAKTGEKTLAQKAEEKKSKTPTSEGAKERKWKAAKEEGYSKWLEAKKKQKELVEKAIGGIGHYGNIEDRMLARIARQRGEVYKTPEEKLRPSERKMLSDIKHVIIELPKGEWPRRRKGKLETVHRKKNIILRRPKKSKKSKIPRA